MLNAKLTSLELCGASLFFSCQAISNKWRDKKRRADSEQRVGGEAARQRWKRITSGLPYCILDESQIIRLREILAFQYWTIHDVFHQFTFFNTTTYSSRLVEIFFIAIA